MELFNKAKLTLIIILISVANLSQAKEIELILKAQTQYPMQIHYQFANNKTLYGKGNIKLIKNDETHYIYVNRIPDEENVLVQIDKMTVGNRTEINDPCEITLGQTDLIANITIGFTGNPDTHGSFTCSVSKN